MSLASDSHLVGYVDIGRLLSIGELVRFNWPESRRIASAQRRRRFRAAVEEFTALLYQVDIDTLGDSELADIERATRTVAELVDLHMMFDCDTSECQLSADVSHRLRDAIAGIERGLPIDPSKRPSDDELMNQLAERIRTAV